MGFTLLQIEVAGPLVPLVSTRSMLLTFTFLQDDFELHKIWTTDEVEAVPRMFLMTTLLILTRDF